MRAQDNMAKVYAQLDERLTKFIVAQPISFVASALRQRFHDRGGLWGLQHPQPSAIKESRRDGPSRAQPAGLARLGRAGS